MLSYKLLLGTCRMCNPTSYTPPHILRRIPYHLRGLRLFQRQVLPLIRWRDTATAAASERRALQTGEWGYQMVPMAPQRHFVD